FQSKATNRWKVAVSTPVHHEGRIVGVLALTVDIGVFMQFDDSTPGFFAVLVDGRAGGREGMILQHPLFDQLQQDRLRLPDSFSRLRVRLDQFPNAVSAHYEDPLAEDELGKAY